MDSGMYQRFAAHAAAAPDRPAVVAESGTLTYRRLDERVRSLAAFLRRSGAGPGRVVTVAEQPSAEAVAAVLAALATGAAYRVVPAGSAGTPGGAGSVAVAATAASGTAGAGTHVPDLFGPPDPAAPAVLGPDGACRLTHAGLAAHLAAAVTAYPGLCGTVLLHTGLRGPAAVTGPLGALYAGGCVQLYELEDAAYLGWRPTLLCLSPAELPLLDELPDEVYPSGQLVVAGGVAPSGTVERLRRRHPDVTVLLRPDGLDPGYGLDRGYRLDDRPAPPEEAVVTAWRTVYDGLYAPDGGSAFGEDFAGWTSSYDGLPIPVREMREWRCATVDRIRSLAPRRVLEIGVGSGLLLAKLAPECETYWACDLSGAVIERLRGQLGSEPELAGRVTLERRAAHELDGLPAGFFDTVVLNSVVQYFPSGAYLTGVVARAMALLAPGGALFLGDIRNLRLHRLLHTAIRLGRAAADDQAPAIRRAAERSRALEKELLIDPDFFLALRGAVPDIGAVDARIKRGRSHNELSRHRYDVVLVKDAPGDPGPCSTVDGTAVSMVDDLRPLLARHPAGVRVVGLPNARLCGEAAAVRLLDDGAPVAAARTALRRAAGVDPADLHALGRAAGLRVVVTWNGGSGDGALDAIFLPGPDPGPVESYRVAPGASWPLVNGAAPVAVREPAVAA